MHDVPVGFEAHDHSVCVASALAEAEESCARERLRLTPVRRRALEILLEAHRALGAYDVLARLQEEGLGAQPPAAYRALDFLVEHGFAHRVERLNAYIACAYPGQDHVPAFLMCRGCLAVAEAVADTSRAALDRAGRETGFAVERMVVEAEGLCAACRRAG